MRVALVALVMVARCATAQISAPSLGYLPDAGKIRPVAGIPSAAAVGDALDLGTGFSQIVPSPSRDYVLVTAADTGVVSVWTPARGIVPIKGVGLAPELMVMSPRGSTAVVWFAGFDNAQIITGLPAAPAIRQIDLAIFGEPTALAVSDDGNWLVGAWPNAGVHAVGPYGLIKPLPIDEPAVALGFFAGSHDLAVAIPRRILRFQNMDGLARAALIYDSIHWQIDIAAVAVSLDNRRIVVEDRLGTFIDIDAQTGDWVLANCGCQPQGLSAMGTTAFRIGGLQNGAFQLYDAATHEVLFVPLALKPGETP